MQHRFAVFVLEELAVGALHKLLAVAGVGEPITGLHLTHVLGGVIALTVVALGYKRGRYNADDIEIWSLYWHFVDLVWMFIVPMVYLLNVAR